LNPEKAHHFPAYGNPVNECQVAFKNSSFPVLASDELGVVVVGGGRRNPAAICRRVAHDALSFTCNSMDGGVQDILGYQSLADTQHALYTHTCNLFLQFHILILHQCPSPQRSKLQDLFPKSPTHLFSPPQLLPPHPKTPTSKPHLF
jgi:hypothetical protein